MQNVLARHRTNSVLEHIEINAARLDTYDATRAEIVRYAEAGRTRMSGAAAMDLDAVSRPCHSVV